MDKLLIENPELLADALQGLRGRPKRLNSKWFYDLAGSALFEDITVLPEYYPTRTEIAILEAEAPRLARYLPPGSALVELGSGASLKTRILLDQSPGLAAYVPLDISAKFLTAAAAVIDNDYPGLPVAPIVGDFLAPITMPERLQGVPKTAFFPGSTIGNLDADTARDLLASVRGWEGITSFILGADLVKDRDVLIAAYDDAAGVTAQFNLNLLRRLNREAGATFAPSRFTHEARWDEAESRIEMHLVSTEAQTVEIGGITIPFAKGESIHTENSHKYTSDSITSLATSAGWSVAEFLTDPDALFAVVVLKV